MTRWQDVPMEIPAIGFRGKMRLAFRLILSAVILGTGLAAFLSLRLIERVLRGHARPWTPAIVGWVCENWMRIIGFRYKVHGTPMHRHGAMVSNHVGLLDIVAFSAITRGFFVSKTELAHWPIIGFLARVTGTMFIVRKSTDAKRQKNSFEARLKLGHRLIFFPEGTSSDGLRILPFKSSLFEAFFNPELRFETYIQPVSLRYIAPKNTDPRFYGWWGEMDFAPSFTMLLAQKEQGSLEVTFHPELAVADFPDRKALAAQCEAAIRSGAV